MIKSAANCKGYYNNPEETQRLFQDGFIASGDIGYLDTDGGLYVLGRRKNIIKHLGQAIAAQELEEIVDALSSVRFSAAVGIDREWIEGKQIHLFAGIRGSLSESDFEERTIQIVESIHARIGIRPARVLFINAHGIARTHSGKIQHAVLREKYLSGDL